MRMRLSGGLAIGLVVAVSTGVARAAIGGSSVHTAILVDKKTNSLQVCEYTHDGLKVLKTYRATIGQVQGDKETEGDLKTPEGIYLPKTKLTPPGLKPKFGNMAFYLNYPNAYDQIAGRTGKDIMLHATNEPERLSRNYDSEGCVVIKNEDIDQVNPFIRLGLTPVLIFSELTPEYLKVEAASPLRTFFEKWLGAWEQKELDSYIGSYHSEFVSTDGQNKDAYRAYKGALNKRYSKIQVGAEDIHFYRHPKYSLVTFTQNYQSALIGGGSGHKSRGTKLLYVAEESGEPKIIAEAFGGATW